MENKSRAEKELKDWIKKSFTMVNEGLGRNSMTGKELNDWKETH